MTDRINVEVEVRAAVDGPMLRGVILAEGRAARGGRAELFAPGAVCWPADGIAILAEHRGRELARVLPTREANGEIRIETRATDDIRRAVDVDGRRFLSVEFFAHRETLTAAGVREIERATVDAAALVPSGEYAQATAEVRSKREVRLWL